MHRLMPCSKSPKFSGPQSCSCKSSRVTSFPGRDASIPNTLAACGRSLTARPDFRSSPVLRSSSKTPKRRGRFLEEAVTTTFTPEWGLYAQSRIVDPGEQIPSNQCNTPSPQTNLALLDQFSLTEHSRPCHTTCKGAKIEGERFMTRQNGILLASILLLMAATGVTSPLQGGATNQKELNKKLPHYSVHNLGALGGTSSSANGINNKS